MANRVGKYKLSKKESALSLADGGTVAGNMIITGLQTPGSDPEVDGQLFCSSSVDADATGSAKIVLCSQG